MSEFMEDILNRFMEFLTQTNANGLSLLRDYAGITYPSETREIRQDPIAPKAEGPKGAQQENLNIEDEWEFIEKL